jgi:hypothetical protein
MSNPRRTHYPGRVTPGAPVTSRPLLGRSVTWRQVVGGRNNLDPPEPDGFPGAPKATDPTPDSKPSAADVPPAMTPYAIAVALFAAFVVGGVLGRAVPLWVVVVAGLAVGAAVFVFVDRYPRLPGRGWTRRT